MDDFLTAIVLLFGLIAIVLGVPALLIGIFGEDVVPLGYDILCCQEEGTACIQVTGLTDGYDLPECPDEFVFKSGKLWALEEYLDGGGQ